ncbi:PfkB family carbohydrate kinase [uncultured Brachyspira sp.]|uniref:carbohydrate kinase family protein n=1 Tax=uncultured Brachyspira sp. TaxID=221953 RepID=UPI0025F9FACB|nr:PfkB family carbohydrate kinase [uncultured Brachyspira sp.]
MFNVLSFGELLYDVYNNDAVIGGASFNYSLQLSRLLKKDDKLKFITALGNDNYSKDALKFIKNENIDGSLIQILNNYDTGIALVFLNDKKVPDYIIHENAAWDNIEYSDDINYALEDNYDMFYFNILSQRNEKSYNTLKTICKNINAEYKVCDVTFRKNYYTKEKIKESFEFVNILKINDDELYIIKELFYSSLKNDNESLLKYINKDFDIDYIFITLGALGACVFYNNEYIFNPSNKVNVADTVGAGDSFCAALSYTVLKGLDINNILKFASCISEEMVQLKGGTAKYDVNKAKSEFNL